MENLLNITPSNAKASELNEIKFSFDLLLNKKSQKYYDKLIATYKLYFCNLIEKGIKLRKTLNFDKIDYEEYDKIYKVISKFYNYYINYNVSEREKKIN